MNKRVMVTGAGGFIGKHTVKELLRQGYSVTAFDCRPLQAETFSEENCKESEESCKDNCTFILGDVRNKGDVERACEGADAIIHLAGAIRLSEYQDNYDIHVTGAQNLVAACQKHGVRRIIAYSSIAATKDNPGSYGSTKKLSEEVFLFSPLDVTILRPTIVFGDESIGLQTIVKQIRAYPLLIPLIGSGKATRQPVWVNDMVAVTINSLWNTNSYGKAYDIGGADVISFRELVQIIKKELGVRKTLVPLPVFFAKAIAKGFEMGTKNPPFTSENVRNVTLNTAADIEPARKDLDFNPAPLHGSLQEALKNFK